MRVRNSASVLAAVAGLLTFGLADAIAAERGCAAITIGADAAFAGRFPELLARVREELSVRSDLDSCARVELRLERDPGIVLLVSLPDGRAASRSVRRPEDVLPSLQALLVVPEPPASSQEEPLALSSPAAGTKTRPPSPLRPRMRLPARAVEADRLSDPPLAARNIGVELSALGGVRAGDGQFGYGMGVLSFLEVKSWLIGAQGRVDGYRSILGSDPATALELSLLAGRRFDFGSTALDLTAGPGVAMKGIAFSDRQAVSVQQTPAAMPPPAPRSEPSSGPVPRFLAGARLGFSPRSVFRSFVALELDVGRTRSFESITDSDASTTRMPSFTLGLAVGATVGTP